MLKNKLYLNNLDKRKINHIYKESIDNTYDDDGNEIGGVEIPISDNVEDIIRRDCIEQTLNKLPQKTRDMFKLSLVGYNSKDIGKIIREHLEKTHYYRVRNT